MASQAATAFNGNVKKALAGLRRINLEGLRWRVFDAKGQVLGRLASQISTVVQGKDKPTYAPNRDDGNMCIVINATGRKMTDKVYYWHTVQVSSYSLSFFDLVVSLARLSNAVHFCQSLVYLIMLKNMKVSFLGHLKERTLKDQMAKDPTEVIRKAVMRMLPRNKLRDDRDRKLRIFAGNEHPFGDRPIEPYVMPPRAATPCKASYDPSSKESRAARTKFYHHQGQGKETKGNC